MAKVAQWEAEAAQLSEDDALALLTEKSNAFAEAKLEEWWDFAGHIWAKFGRYVVTYNETEQGEDAAGQVYPDWWLKNPYVGFTTWKRDGPHVGLHGGLDVVLIIGDSWNTIMLAGNLLLILLVAIVARQRGFRNGKRAALEDIGYAAEP